MKQVTVIRRGKLNSETLNFTGFTLSGDKVFLPAKQVKDWIADLCDDEGQLKSKDANGKAITIHCITETRTHNEVERDDAGEVITEEVDGLPVAVPKRDANGNIKTFTRVDSLFADVDPKVVYQVANEELIEAGKAKVAVIDSLKEIGLDADTISAMLKASIEI